MQMNDTLTEQIAAARRSTSIFPIVMVREDDEDDRAEAWCYDTMTDLMCDGYVEA